MEGKLKGSKEHLLKLTGTFLLPKLKFLVYNSRDKVHMLATGVPRTCLVLGSSGRGSK